MWRGLFLGLLGCLIGVAAVHADDPAIAGLLASLQDEKTARPGEPAPKAAQAPANASQPTKPTESLQESLQRYAREIQTLRDQYSREMDEQKKRAELQQKQIEILQQTAQLLAEQLKKQAAAPVSGQAIDKLQAKTELLESRASQAARRDQELAKATDNLRESLDAQVRYGPRLPAPLKELFLPSYTNETPVSIYRPDAGGIQQAERTERKLHHDGGLSLLPGSAQQEVSG